MATVDPATNLHLTNSSTVLETTSKILHIGKGVVIKGEVMAPGNSFIGGRLEGQITTENLIVAPGAKIAARVTLGPLTERREGEIADETSAADENAAGDPSLGREFAMHRVVTAWPPEDESDGRRTGDNITEPTDHPKRLKSAS